MIAVLHVALGVRYAVAYLVLLTGLRVYDLVHNIKRKSNDETTGDEEGRLMLYHGIEVNQLSLALLQDVAGLRKLMLKGVYNIEDGG